MQCDAMPGASGVGGQPSAEFGLCDGNAAGASAVDLHTLLPWDRDPHSTDNSGVTMGAV